jgi:hypothetical protein
MLEFSCFFFCLCIQGFEMANMTGIELASQWTRVEKEVAAFTSRMNVDQLMEIDIKMTPECGGEFKSLCFANLFSPFLIALIFCCVLSNGSRCAVRALAFILGWMENSQTSPERRPTPFRKGRTHQAGAWQVVPECHHVPIQSE